MAVACTTTINTEFGAMVVAAGSGVILNNEMEDFASAPGVPNVFGLIGGDANAVAPGKRPLSSMAPVIARRPATRAGAMPARVFVAGGSGGPLIISGTLQALLGAVDFGLDAAGAVGAPRVHHQWAPPILAVEGPIDDATRADLVRRGHEVRPLPFAGAVQAADYRDGRFDAGADPRKHGGVWVGNVPRARGARSAPAPRRPRIRR
jgi:gamma-glutamyltranspeptidase/glutathione hydrolase